MLLVLQTDNQPNLLIVAGILFVLGCSVPLNLADGSASVPHPHFSQPKSFPGDSTLRSRLTGSANLIRCRFYSSAQKKSSTLQEEDENLRIAHLIEYKQRVASKMLEDANEAILRQ